MFGRGGRGGGGGQVCQFFLQGRCKFGGMVLSMATLLIDEPRKFELTSFSDNCKNEHPSGQDSAQSQGGFGNRFAPLNNNNNQARNRSGAFGSSSMSLPSHCSFLSVACCKMRGCRLLSCLPPVFKLPAT
jgi:nucleoporin NUP42